MGTRAAFWIGDPRDLENREWLGCIAWDGHPGNFAQDFLPVHTEGRFRMIIEKISKERNDFSSPDKGWPFPWEDNIFLTDYTYAFFDGKLHVSCYFSGFITFEYFLTTEDPFPEDRKDDHTCYNVPSGKKYDQSQPDSIMIFRAPG